MSNIIKKGFYSFEKSVCVPTVYDIEEKTGFLYVTINGIKTYYKPHLESVYKERYNLLNQAIRANRDYSHILKLSEDLDEVINPLMKKQVI